MRDDQGQVTSSEVQQIKMEIISSATLGKNQILRIAICLPELRPLLQVMSGESADATYIIQSYLASGLRAHGHSLTFIAPRNLYEIDYARDLSKLQLGPQTWSASHLFDLTSRGAWRIQRSLGIPYLNVFSNYRLFDACLRCLPGHDIVYERNGLYRNGVAMACKRLRLPYVLYFEADDILEHDFMDKPITGILRYRASQTIRYNLKTANCIICVSEPGKIHLMTTWGVPADKIVVFPNAADVHRFQPFPETRADVRATLGVDSNPMIIFVGNFYKWHDLETLLNAFAQVLIVYPDARLVLVGDGSQHQTMIQVAADRGISHAVRFTGLVAHTEIPRLLGAADIAVALYPVMKNEMWLSPIKVFEYMASGTAVIASAVGQLADVIHDGVNGLLVPPGDVTAISGALKRLIGDQNLRSNLGQKARDDAVCKYSWEHYLSRLEQLFGAIIADKPVNII